VLKEETTMPITVLDPTAARRAAPVRPARGLASLRGVRVGLLDNGKINVARFLDHVEAILRSEHGVADVVHGGGDTSGALTHGI
jgi:hypothetical protein